eukprot:11917199-Alexandrium_andersonii.AAC.1
MSASLVGSEMCIRDRFPAALRPGTRGSDAPADRAQSARRQGPEILDIASGLPSDLLSYKGEIYDLSCDIDLP